jgi:hypothetical protein
MKRFLIISAILTTHFSYTENPEMYLKGRLSSRNGRYHTFCEALKLMSDRNMRVIIETGTARCGDTNFEGDGGATIIFGHWAQNHKAQFYSVDINEKHLETAHKAVKPYLDSTTMVLMDSATFLKNFDQKIDLLYLDSWDYDDKNPLPSQIHNLNEVKAAYDKLTEKSIIMIDDCNIGGGGKGLLSIKWLLDRGWYLHANAHQVILLRKKA